MSIVIHQAIYGDKNDGHALLKTTLPDEKLANKISNSTDLSDRGSNWTPAVRGFSFEDFYLIVKTYSDTSQGMRLGRVFSHVLIIQKADIEKIDNLNTLFNSFRNEIDKNIDFSPIVYQAGEPNTKIPYNRALKAVHGLLNEQSVVWIGQEQFPEAVAAIWKNLWDTARFDFQFGINFNPSAVLASKQSMVCTPETYRSKWQNTQFCIVDVEDTLTAPTPAELYLLNTETQTTFTEFLDQLGTRPKSLKQLSLLEKGLETFANLENITDFNEIYNLYNIIRSYLSTAGVKKDLLKKVLKRIIQIIPDLNSQSINALRKLEITKEIEPLKLELETAIETWLENNLFNESFNEKEDASKLVLNSISEESHTWWNTIMVRSLKDHFVVWQKHYASTLLKWLNKDPSEILKAVSKYFSSSKSIEDDLESVFSTNKSEEVSQQVLPFCRKNNWVKLHARILLQLKTRNILKEQIKVDIDPSSMEGIKLIAANIDNKQFIHEALVLDDVRLFMTAGEITAQKKELLSEFKISEPGWQKILLCTFRSEKTLKDLFKNPYKEVVFPLLNLVLEDKTYDEDLLAFVGQSEFANIQDYPGRKDIWAKLPTSVKEDFLFSTISNISLKTDFLEQNLEDPLNKAVQTHKFISYFIEVNVPNIGVIINFFVKYSGVPEKYLFDYLKDINSNFNGLDAQKLGKLIYNRNWRNCLDIVQNKARNNQSFKVAFQECCGLLNFWAYSAAAWQGLITKVDISLSDWWQSLEELACGLYPEGPVDNKIWKRAGGDESELQHKATGQVMWRNALHKLNNGGTKKITVNNLLTEMKKDFPVNGDLNILIEIKKKI